MEKEWNLIKAYLKEEIAELTYYNLESAFELKLAMREVEDILIKHGFIKKEDL